jgi:DNA repair ATPase RecN
VAHLTLSDTVRSLRSDLSRVEGRRDAARSRLQQAEAEVLRLTGEEQVLDRVADLFRVLIDREVVDNAKSAESLLTEGLKAVFDDMDLAVRSEVDVQRGKVSVDLYTVQTQPNGVKTEAAATEAYGGSVSVVQSVLLRVVVTLRRGMRPLLLLDESLGAVAEQYVPRVGQFLRLLSERVGMDILAVTHNPVLVEAAHKAYRIRKDNGEATFVEVRV